MDESETYIKMSEKSPLQALWQPSAWDYIYCRYEKKVVVLSGYPTDSGFYGHGIDNGDECHDSGGYYRRGGSWDAFKKDHFCLFRQDQLQEMIDWANLTTLLSEVLNFAGYPESYGKHPDPLIKTLVFKWDSMEQLWHAFVVKELYQKVWNGEDWV